MSKRDALAALHTLTVSECRILYWRCRELSYEEIAKKLFVTERTVYFHMGHVYDKLGLQEHDKTKRLWILSQLYCPLLQQEVENPETDCGRQRKPDEEPLREPPKDVIALVRYDNPRSLMRSERAIQGSAAQENPDPLPVVVISPRPQPGRQRRGFLWLLMGVVLGAAAAVFVLTRVVPGFGPVVNPSGDPGSVVAHQGQTPGVSSTLANTPVVDNRATAQPAQTGAKVSAQTPTTGQKPTVIPKPALPLPFEGNSSDLGVVVLY